MAIYNTKTKERRLEGKIISERGTFRMDTSMDKIVYWCDEDNHPKTMYLAQCDEYVERGSDLDEETKAKYYAYEKARVEKARKYYESIEATTIKKGSTVCVFKGRKVKIGTVGTVLQKMENS